VSILLTRLYLFKENIDKINQIKVESIKVILFEKLFKVMKFNETRNC